MPFDLAVATLVLACGAVLAVVMPALAGFDEPVHFVRAWQVSDGGIFPRERVKSDGTTDLFARVPRSLPVDMRAILRDGLFDLHDAQFVYSHLGDPAPHGARTWVGLEGAGEYSPVPYLPSALAIRLGRGLGLSTLALIEVARIAQVLAYAALIGLAVRRIRHRGAVVAVLALAPVALIQVATVSADPLTTALTLLVIAEASHLLSLRSADIGRWQLGEVVAVLVALALAKPPYFLAAAFLLVPMWRHRGRVAAGLGGGLAAAGGLALAWNHWAQNHFVRLTGGVAPRGFESYAFHNVEPKDQFGYVRSHPLRFLSTIGRTLARYPGDLVHGAFAQSPTWRPPGVMVLCVLVLLAAALAASPEPVAGGGLMRLLGAAVAVVLFVSLFLLAYVGWNAVAAPRIDAFQGRYLLPVVAVLAIVAAPAIPLRLPAGNESMQRFARAILAGSAATALWVALGMARFFYF